jgi:sortase system peptidoglycan-associated protein
MKTKQTNKAFTTATTSLAFISMLSVSAFSTASQKVSEEELKSQENTNTAVGFGTGVVFGAAVAGPVGAAVAGLFGLFIADDINDEKRLELSKNDLQMRTTELSALQKEYEMEMEAANAQIAAMDSAVNDAIQQVTPNLETNIQFKTASFLIEDHYKSQLDGLASQLRKNPKLKIELSGFADQRGESQYNQVLSEQRANAVKDYLVSQFVNDEQIITQSFGESELVSKEGSFEENFFDRRVQVKVSSKEAEMTAANN